MSEFYRYGPFWQAECDICHEMSDCFDTPKELDGWIERHDCAKTFERALTLSAREAGWKVEIVRPDAKSR